MSEVVFEDKYLIDKLRKLSGMKVRDVHTVIFKVRMDVYEQEAEAPMSVWVFQRDNRSRLSVAMDVDGWMYEPKDIKSLDTISQEILEYVKRNKKMAMMYKNKG